MISSGATCILAVLSIYFCSIQVYGSGEDQFYRFMGVSGDMNAICCCLLSVGFLFLGPVVESCQFSIKNLFKHIIGYRLTWPKLRNEIAAPITEEVVFRACVARAFLGQGCSLSTTLYGGPFLFCLAHVHHNISIARRQFNLTACLFQVSYTYIFGILSMYLLLRTGSLVGVILSHSFCNVIGFPEFSFVKFHSSRDNILAGIYILGIILFFCTLQPLTANFNSPFQ